MDYLAKKHEYTFWNNKRSLVCVYVTQIANSPYNIWVEGKTKKYRDSAILIEKALKDFNRAELPLTIIVADSKMGSGGISSYNHDDDIIYYNSYYHSKTRVNQIVNGKLFASQNVSDIIRHELGHKLHWDAVKIVLGLLAITGILPVKRFNHAPGLINFYKNGWFPNGFSGVFTTMLTVNSAFFRTELIDITAGEAENPQKAISSAINTTL